MFDAPWGDIRDMDEPINSLFNLYESAEVCEVANAAADDGADRVSLGQSAPWIGLGLFETKGDAPAVQIEVENDGFNILSQLKHLRRMLHSLAPGHFGNVNQSLDARLQFNEGTVVGQVDDFPGNPRADRIYLAHERPRIVCQLLVSKRHAFLVAVVFQDLYGDFVADI